MPGSKVDHELGVTPDFHNGIGLIDHPTVLEKGEYRMDMLGIDRLQFDDDFNHARRKAGAGVPRSTGSKSEKE